VKTHLEQDDRVQPIEQVHARRFDGELVLLDLAGGEYYALNAIGATIWEALTAGNTLAEVARLLTAHYDVGFDDALADCLGLTAELLDRGLVRKQM
jgi:hypothetical protein